MNHANSTAADVTSEAPTPLSLMGMIGYQGNVTVNGEHRVRVGSGATEGRACFGNGVQ